MAEAPLPSRRSGFDPDWTIAPGATLREWREENGLGPTSAAITCGRMQPEMFERIERGVQRITPKIAQQLQAGTCIPARLWLHLERRYRADLKAGKTDTTHDPGPLS